VILYQSRDLGRILTRKAQPAADALGNPHAHLDMPVKPDAVWSTLKGRRLTNIVQQCSPCERRRDTRRQLLKQQQRMYPHIALGMIFGRLLNPREPVDLRQHLPKKTSPVEKLNGLPRPPFGEHPGQLIANALAADLRNSLGMSPDRRLGLRLDLELK